ncbi:MAG: V-type ATP synthase subunit E [Oliverpabstia sp.]|uniref:V-type ATP synthase subunit E n=1 Tax=Blautia sp. TaxID=1955243 RepID=UPI00260288B5|nr:V-type ATP synthase subunit E [Blautia sp.]MDD6414165.1 V-type ATP synthase subunit E [Blautia sp.]MDY4117135.1 V-type ATP synthase subunit E [Blautia sp.]MDY5026809.1 V-type ATP synthase subunit E [Oliverpabstia sp.]
MTIDEKLSHFYDITVEDARTKAAAILEEHKEALEKMTAERKALSEENAQAQIKAETANARREVNKALSAEQLTIKRDWTKKQNELKEKLFSEVKELLDSFTKTPEYETYLTGKIKEALDFAEDDEISVYLSPEDSALAEKLQQTTGVTIQIAKDSFLGGIRATIPQKNILIDHSFAGNFEAAYKEFKFDGGPEHE